MTFFLFLAAASVIALSPGPGIFYVAARTLADGRSTGLASSLGTGVGGLVHVAAGAVGVSALIMASAEAFAFLKIAGAVYLVWLGIKTAREARIDAVATMAGVGMGRAFRDGVVVGDNLAIDSLRRFKDDVTEVRTDFEAGIGLGKFNDIQVGDEIETIELKEKVRA